MIAIGTLIILALWLAFIWFVDPDGFASRGRRFERIHVGKRRLSDAGLGSLHEGRQQSCPARAPGNVNRQFPDCRS